MKLSFWVNIFINKKLTLFTTSLSFYTVFTIIPLLLIILTLVTSLLSFEIYYESIKSLYLLTSI